MSVLFVCQFWASGATGAPVVGGVCSVRLSILGLWGNWGSSCRGCLFFSSVNSGPQGQLGLQLSGMSVLFVCQFWASGATGAPAVGGVSSFRLSNLGLGGNWGSSCRGCLFFSSILGPGGNWGSSCRGCLFFSSVLCLSSLSVFLTIFIICHSSVILVCLICRKEGKEGRKEGVREEGRILIQI